MTDKAFKLRIGISACLLGEPVRYNGGDKKNSALMALLSQHVEWVAVCPEVEMGLPVPREPMRLERIGKEVRMIGIDSRKDYTKQLHDWAKGWLEQLATEDLCGCILKRNSPSCGVKGVPVYDQNGSVREKGVGLFAKLLMQNNPFLPVEDEEHLSIPERMENFIERMFAFCRLKEMLSTEPTPDDLVAFLTAHELSLMAHSIVNYQRLGRLVAKSRSTASKSLITQYASLFMRTLRIKTTPQKHAKVLYHVLSYFEKDLTHQEKEECVRVIEAYRQGKVALSLPVSKLKHYLSRYPSDWLGKQTYFNPHSKELLLRGKLLTKKKKSGLRAGENRNQMKYDKE